MINKETKVRNIGPLTPKYKIFGNFFLIQKLINLRNYLKISLSQDPWCSHNKQKNFEEILNRKLFPRIWSLKLFTYSCWFPWLLCNKKISKNPKSCLKLLILKKKIFISSERLEEFMNLWIYDNMITLRVKKSRVSHFLLKINFWEKEGFILTLPILMDFFQYWPI